MTPSRSPQGEEEAVDAPSQREEDASADAEAMREKMRALAARRWEGERRKAALADAATDLEGSDGRVALVRVPVPVGDIMRQLSHDARGGDTAAARELRAWLSQFPPDDGAADASDLAAPQRSRIAALLAKLIAEDDETAAQHTIREGTKSGFDALPDAASSEPGGHPRSDGSHPIGRGSRPLEGIDTPPTADTPPSEANGSHDADGTVTPQQMTVEDCIEVAESD